MNTAEFYAELKQGVLRPCYLFEGEEEYTKESALQALRAKVLVGDFADMNETVLIDPAADALIAAAETLPFLADKRFVVVRECGQLASGRGKKEEEGGSAASPRGGENLADYISRLPDTACVVFFERGKAAATRKLYKQINKVGGLVSFDTLSHGDLIKWIAKELKQTGQNISRKTAEQIIFTVGTDMTLLSNELAKLAAYAHGCDVVTEEDVAAVCTKTVEYKVFDLSDAVVAGDAERATSLMNALLRDGEQRLMLLALLQRQYRQLLFAKILSGSRVATDEAARVIGAPPFVVRKLTGIARGYARDELEWAYRMLVDTEFLVKSGQRPEEGALEQAVYQLLARRMEKQHA